MVEYEKISIKDYLNLDAEKAKGNYYEVKGIPRGISLRERSKPDLYEYMIDFFIQSEDGLLLPAIYSDMANSAVAYQNFNLLSAASEGDLEATVRGYADVPRNESNPQKIFSNQPGMKGDALIEVGGQKIIKKH